MPTHTHKPRLQKLENKSCNYQIRLNCSFNAAPFLLLSEDLLLVSTVHSHIPSIDQIVVCVLGVGGIDSGELLLFLLPL